MRGASLRPDRFRQRAAPVPGLTWQGVCFIPFFTRVTSESVMDSDVPLMRHSQAINYQRKPKVKQTQQNLLDSGHGASVRTS